MSCPACGAASQDPTGYCAACRLRLQDSIETGYQSSQDVAATIRVLSAAHANEETREPVGRSQFFDDLQTLPSGAQVGGPGRSESAQAARSGAGSGPLQVGQTFGARYHILKILGVGGMGAVYQAWDAELGEAVAIKVIRPEVMADPIAARELENRFKRELLLARQVTHKNVVRIHDLGEIGGIKFITMSYVEGTDLATLLKQAGALDVERTLGLVRSMVDGLIAAHAAGVVHCDLKPGNIMIRSDGEALIMDFGIARSTSSPRDLSQASMATLPADLRASATRYTQATMTGAIAGTVQYMAPEQAKGESVDQRADIYALGLIVYDMLAGRARAKHAESALAELDGRMEKPPWPIQTMSRCFTGV